MNKPTVLELRTARYGICPLCKNVALMLGNQCVGCKEDMDEKEVCNE